MVLKPEWPPIFSGLQIKYCNHVTRCGCKAIQGANDANNSFPKHTQKTRKYHQYHANWGSQSLLYVFHNGVEARVATDFLRGADKALLHPYKRWIQGSTRGRHWE